MAATLTLKKACSLTLVGLMSFMLVLPVAQGANPNATPTNANAKAKAKTKAKVKAPRTPTKKAPAKAKAPTRAKATKTTPKKAPKNLQKSKAPLAPKTTFSRSKNQLITKQKKAQEQQASLSAQMQALKAELDAKEKANTENQNALKKAELSISSTQSQLRQLKNERQTLQGELSKLSRSQAKLESSLSMATQDVDTMIRAQYLNAQINPMRAFLSGVNPNAHLREQAQLRYLQREKQAAITKLDKHYQDIQLVKAKQEQRRTEITAIEARQQKEQLQLMKDKRDREKAIALLTSQIESDHVALARFKQDQLKLNHLIGSLDKAQKDLEVEEANRRAQALAQQQAEAKEAERLAQAKKSTPRAEVPPSPSPIKTVSLGPRVNLASLKGRLTYPVNGTVTHRFGQARQDMPGSQWQGFRFKAPEGSDVKAVAPGKVVYADWLRGFGNLIIVDHAHGYMTVYANNDALLKKIGDNVQQGETISTVGTSGGNKDPGLYFELRKNGKPINPKQWFRN